MNRIQGYKFPIVNPRWPPKIKDGHRKIKFLTFSRHDFQKAIALKERKNFIGKFKTCRKKIWSIEQFLSELLPFEICTKMVKMGFSGITKKKILTFEYYANNLFRSEFYNMCVANLVKID